MRLYRTDYPIVTQEVNYLALREAIEETFAREYGPEAVRHVRVNHFNPDMMGLQVGFLVTERD